MDIREILIEDETAIVEDAAQALASLEHYRRDGEQASRTRLAALHRQVVQAVLSRDLRGLRVHVGLVARERFEAGYDLREVLAAFAALEEAVGRRARTRLGDADLAWGIGLVATAFTHARSAAGRAFVAVAPRTAASALDLTAVFEGVDAVPPRRADEFVYPV